LEIGDDTANDYSGPIVGAAGTTLDFDGVNTFSSSTFNAANVFFYGGTFTVADRYQATSTNAVGSTVNFTGTVNGFGALNLINVATVDLTQATLASGAATLPSLSLPGNKLIAPQALTVSGLFTGGGTLTGCGSLTANGGMTGGAVLDNFTLNNAAYGILDRQITARCSTTWRPAPWTSGPTATSSARPCSTARTPSTWEP
jgi:hypothetical protein